MKDFYTVSIPNMPTPFGKKNKETWDRASELLKSLEGFYGLHPYFPHGTLLFFESLNTAKAARNILRSKLNAVGKNICRAEFDEETGGMVIKEKADE